MKWRRAIIRLLIRVDGFFDERRIILAFLDYCVGGFVEFSGHFCVGLKKKKKKRWGNCVLFFDLS